MRVPSFALLAYLVGARTICAQVIPSSSRLPSSRITPTSTVGQPTTTACPGNTPDDRSTWCQYSIDTDYELVVPETGVTREYWFDVDELNLAPEGFSRPVMAVNKTIPGPTIFADWGDWVVVHVTNHLDQVKNGSSIHWHGIRQNYTNQNDGVVSVTQCPIAPGSSMTYRWRAVQYGSSWYHSHIGLQAWEGVFGGIVINGPATANYDVDKGSLFLNDWTHATADELYEKAETTGPFKLDNGLINGTNVLGTGANETTGSRFTMKVDEGTSYRLRLVNAAIDTHWNFQIDNHTLTVIAMDFVPIEPFTTDILSIGMGMSARSEAPCPLFPPFRRLILITAHRSTLRCHHFSKSVLRSRLILDPSRATISVFRQSAGKQHPGHTILPRHPNNTTNLSPDRSPRSKLPRHAILKPSPPPHQRCLLTRLG